MLNNLNMITNRWLEYFEQYKQNNIDFTKIFSFNENDLFNYNSQTGKFTFKNNSKLELSQIECTNEFIFFLFTKLLNFKAYLITMGTYPTYEYKSSFDISFSQDDNSPYVYNIYDSEKEFPNQNIQNSLILNINLEKCSLKYVENIIDWYSYTKKITIVNLNSILWMDEITWTDFLKVNSKNKRYNMNEFTQILNICDHKTKKDLIEYLENVDNFNLHCIRSG
jgi:hypothetical protein